MTAKVTAIQAAHDFGPRDLTIRCQTYSPVQRLPGVPLETFAAYWRDVHGPLCSRLPGLGYYVQFHFSRDKFANLWPLPKGVKRIDFPLDGAVEIGFPNAEDMDVFSRASHILFGDEINVFGWDAAYFLPDGSRTYVDRQADGIPNGPDKLHRVHVYLHGSLDEEFKNWAGHFAKTLADDSRVLKLRIHLPRPYDNADPQPPSPVDHHVRDDMLTLAVMEIGFANALIARQFLEGEAFRATQDGQARHVKAMAAYLVTGVYTFVRDSVPTIAGLRGSRTAELIEQTGATNHLAPGVTNLFTRKAT
jgi:hypothetical protein